jgi:cytochrome c biogenesis protein CcmG, thiol:disulfide interchange protein DsbE
MTARASEEETPARAKPKATLVLPLVLVAILLAFLLVALRSGEPSQLPSALIGKPVPEFSLPGIPNVLGDFGPASGLSSAVFKRGKVSLLNVWASWCAPCLAEHPQLIELSQQGIHVYSINYKDKPEAARRFLSSHGNPFRSIGADENGMTAIDFGVYGVPETFVIDGRGQIAYRYPGPITPEVLADKIMPAIHKAQTLQFSAPDAVAVH